MNTFRKFLFGGVAAAAFAPYAALAEDGKPAWAAEATMNPDYVAGSSAAPESKPTADAAPAATGTPAWAAEATMNPDYKPGASSAPAEAGVEMESTVVDAPAAPAAGEKPAWAAEATMNPDYKPGSTSTPAATEATETPSEAEAPPAPTGGEGVTQYYGTTEKSGTPAWAAEATMNPDYTAKPADAAAPAAAPAAADNAGAEQAIEGCRDALNAEATAGKLLFSTSSWAVTQSSYKTLDAIAQIAKDCGDVVIEVGGHTDNIGKPSSNMTISKLRADAVVAYLKRAGVDASRLKAAGYGEERPVASNDTADGRRQNRRIEFLVTER